MKRKVAREIKDLHILIKDAIGKMEKPPHGINYTQGSILFYLFKHENELVYQKDLEDFLHLRKSSISEQIDALEKRGFVYRLIDEKDHRKKCLKLSNKVKKDIESLKKTEDTISDKLTKNIKEEELKVFFSVIDKMKGNMEL